MLLLATCMAFTGSASVGTPFAAGLDSAGGAPISPQSSAGLVLNGIDSFDHSARSVSNAGDVNGDGIDDLIIGAHLADPNDQSTAGESYVVFGRAGLHGTFALRRLLPEAGGDGSAGFVLNGVEQGDFSGYAVSDVGDVNGDGVADVIIGAKLADRNGEILVGEGYVVFGRTTGFPAAFELSSLLPEAGGDGSAGFVLRSGEFGELGRAVSAAGDVNGDGIDDLIIGAYFADANGTHAAGKSYVVFGRATGFPAVVELSSLLAGGSGDGSAGFVLNGVQSSDFSGRSLSGAGDVNGDGIDDFIIGAERGNPDGRFDAGESYVVFGRATGFAATFELRSLLPDSGGDGSAGFVLEGIDPSDFSGVSVGGAGDVNGDGVDDLIIGAVYADQNGRSRSGESYVVFGRTTGFPAAFELRSLLRGAGGDGSAGFVLKGVDAQDLSGCSVSAAGDINGDGIDDLVIGAREAEVRDHRLGQSYVVFGRTTGFPPTFELRSLFPQRGGDGSTGFVLNGVGSGDESGTSVSAAGDVNGDGIADLVIGARYANANDHENVGVTYVVFGRTSGFPAIFELSRLLLPLCPGCE